ncbi:MAG TPA: DUF2842 domain-containing protein [Devosiaceae bacterium]
MTQSQRKFVGVILTLVVLVAYAALASALFTEFLTGLPTWAQLVYFAVAGLGWTVPAMAVIRWMAKPDA